MSIGCEIKVEFHRALTPAQFSEVKDLLANRLRTLMPGDSEILWLSDPADFEYEMLGYSGYSVDDNGNLYDDGANRGSNTVGYGYQIPAGALGGISYLSRWWADSYPDGPMPLYVTTLLTLLSYPLVKRVWYMPDDISACKCKNITREGVLELFEKFISIGHKR
ncbi:hypothetical protein [Cupriavidus sp. WS]|uniref:hypothetical protein n=1 Tax=Cupriavidus sp. WS TaxID=1312922 RepID=UPI00037027EA|nr:hypothetical protein [Cupriavidus sp. WS]